VLVAVDKARQNDAYFELDEAERQAIDEAVNRLTMLYHGHDHNLIRGGIQALDEATRKLAENMMNSAVRAALKGTKL
jgi:hypothetical protein